MTGLEHRGRRMLEILHYAKGSAGGKMEIVTSFFDEKTARATAKSTTVWVV